MFFQQQITSSHLPFRFFSSFLPIYNYNFSPPNLILLTNGPQVFYWSSEVRFSRFMVRPRRSLIINLNWFCLTFIVFFISVVEPNLKWSKIINYRPFYFHPFKNQPFRKILNKTISNTELRYCTSAKYALTNLSLR